MKILVTGFDPFGGEAVNPAIESVKKLPDTIAGAEIIKLEVPTVFYKSLEVIEAAIQEHDPDLILSIGQAGGRCELSVEKVGINLNDGRIADNAGYQPLGTPIFEDGPVGYFSLLPVKAMVENIRKAGVPASVSYTAGTYVCNHVLYGIRYICEHRYPAKRSGFIHIPYLPSQTTNKRNTPSMALDEIVKGITAAIETMVTVEADIEVSAGTTH